MGAAIADMAATCAPTMAVEQVAAIASVESGFSRLAIRFNSGGHVKVPPATEAEAVKLATARIAAGEDIDLGLMGINGALLDELGLTVLGAFDPCLSMKAAEALLAKYRDEATASGAKGAAIEVQALARYFGKGDPLLGELSGFADRISHEQKRLLRELTRLEIKERAAGALPAREFTGGDGEERSRSASVRSVVGVPGKGEEPVGPPPPWDVFGRSRMAPGGGFKTGDAR